MEDWKKHIETDNKKMYGKPVIAGTRVPVDLILDKMSNGRTIPELLTSYPHISEAAILACLKFASESVKMEKVYLLAS